jgi:acyl-[acyl carrier protein]--UDP-N-acetylglucosamine O-acyltransferase
MAQQKNSDYDIFYLIEDDTVRESFRQIYDNTSNLQAQLDAIVEDIKNASDLADLQSRINTSFP